MLSEEERREILETIEASETMRKRYEEAPSDRCRENMILGMVGFTVSDDKKSKEVGDALRELSKGYTLEDLKFLYKYSGPNPARGGIRRRYIRMGGDPKDLVLEEGRR